MGSCHFLISLGVFTFFLHDSPEFYTLQKPALLSHICCKYFRGKYFLQFLFSSLWTRFLNASVSTCMKCPVKFLESLPGHMLAALVLTCQKRWSSFSLPLPPYAHTPNLMGRSAAGGEDVPVAGRGLPGKS